jgi:hypothetical protein
MKRTEKNSNKSNNKKKEKHRRRITINRCLQTAMNTHISSHHISLYNKCNKVDKIFAESLIDYHEKSGLELMKLSVMLEMLESYLDKGK